MAQQTIDIGTTPNDGTGDTLRDAFDKTNGNFDELYLSNSYDNNSTTVVLSEADLNTAYPSVVTGFKVYALDIISGALIYLKTDTGWISSSVTIVT